MQTITRQSVRSALKKKYDSYMVTQFDEFIEEEEYDTDAIKQDIFKKDSEIVETLVLECDVDEDELSKIFISIWQNNNNSNNDDQQQQNDDQNDSSDDQADDDDDDSDDSDDEQEDNAEENNSAYFPTNIPPQQHGYPSGSSALTSPISIQSHQSTISPYKKFLDMLNINKLLPVNDKERISKLITEKINTLCPYLLTDDQSNIIYVFMISYAIHKPLYSWLNDTFDRYKINNNKQTIQSCKPFQSFLNELNKINGKYSNINLCDVFNGAILDNNKCLPSIQFHKQPTYTINDNYYHYVSYVYAINQFLQNKLGFGVADVNQNNNIYPLQLDVWFIPHQIDDKNDDDDDEKEMLEDIEETLLEFDDDCDYAQFSRIKNTNNTGFNQKTHHRIITAVKGCFEEDRFGGLHMRRGARIVLIIDRRESNEDKLFAIKYKDDARINDKSIEYFPEELFQKSINKLLPTEEQKDDDWSLSTDNKNMFGLTYHIIKQDSIKIYMNIKGKTSRFLMNDLFNIWPQYFSNIDRSYITDIKELPFGDLPDDEFYDWYPTVTQTDLNVMSVIKNAELVDNDDDGDDDDNKSAILVVDDPIDNKSASNSINSSTFDQVNDYNFVKQNIKQNVNQFIYQNDNQYDDNMITDDDDGDDDDKNRKKALLDYLDNQASANEFKSHYEIFKVAIDNTFDDTDDDIVENILQDLDLDDEENSDIILQLKNDDNCNDNYQSYIERLLIELQQYKDKYESMDQDQNANANIDDHKIDDDIDDISNNKMINDGIFIINMIGINYLYLCHGECGNKFSSFLFKSDKLSANDKLDILSDYFFSYDYPLRQKLIKLLKNNYNLANGDINDSELKLLKALETEDEYVTSDYINDDNNNNDNDDIKYENNNNNNNKWIELFENVFFSTKNGSNLLVNLSQITCLKSNNNLLRELRSNNTVFNKNHPQHNKYIHELIQNINKIRDNLRDKKIDYIKFTNDEITALFVIASNDTFRILDIPKNNLSQKNHNIPSCLWKSLYFNLYNAINKIKENLYNIACVIPNHLYCYSSAIINQNDLNSYCNQITLWRRNKSHNIADNQTLIELKVDRNRNQNNKQKLKIIPIQWIMNCNMNCDNDLFLILPFEINNIKNDVKTTQNSFINHVISASNYRSLDIVSLPQNH